MIDHIRSHSMLHATTLESSIQKNIRLVNVRMGLKTSQFEFERI